MADTLSDAVIRLKLDTKQARKDADALRVPGGGSPGAVRPTPGKGGGRQMPPSGGGGGSFVPGGGSGGGGGGIIPDPSRPLGPAPGPQPVAPPAQPPPPGQAAIDDAPIVPGTGRRPPIPGTHTQDRIDGRRTRKRLRRVESTSAINSLASTIASIPFVEAVGIGIGASALTDQFGPGIAGGLAQSVRENIPGATGDLIAAALSRVEEGVELNSSAISEFRAVISGLSSVRESVGAEALAGELASPGTSIDAVELASIGQAQFKVTRALTQLQRRSEYLKREATGKALGGGALDAIFKMSMAK